jgi:hypothetical protein
MQLKMRRKINQELRSVIKEVEIALTSTTGLQKSVTVCGTNKFKISIKQIT